MSKILKRPMFRRGGKVNDGIMTGLVDREQFSTGTNMFGNMSEDDIRSNIEMLTNLQNQFSPVSKTRLPLGEVGFALASGASPIDALGVGYKKFVSEDDKRRALMDKRKQAAVSTVLGQAMKTPKDSRTSFQKDLEAAGILRGTPEFDAAVRKKYIDDAKTTAQKNADALGLTGEAREEYIKGATLKTEAAASNLQGQVQVMGKAAKDKIVQNQSFVKTVRTNLDDVTKLLTEDQSLGGASGSIKRLANKLATATEGLGVDIKKFIPKGLEDEVFDTDIARLAALEALIAPAYARVLFPNQRMTNFLVQEAQDKMNLTGLTGTEEVLARLGEITNQFDVYIDKNETLLGNQPVYKDDVKKFKIVDGKLVEIVE